MVVGEHFEKSSTWDWDRLEGRVLAEEGTGKAHGHGVEEVATSSLDLYSPL